MNLDAVNEALTWHPATECRTCGGTVHFEAKNAADASGVEVLATCHGMFGAFFVGRDGHNDSDFLDWLPSVAHMPEKVPEYDVDSSAPGVTEKTRFVVSDQTAKAARCGSAMQINGVRGVVWAIDRTRLEITLGPMP